MTTAAATQLLRLPTPLPTVTDIVLDGANTWTRDSMKLLSE